MPWSSYCFSRMSAITWAQTQGEVQGGSSEPAWGPVWYNGGEAGGRGVPTWVYILQFGVGVCFGRWLTVAVLRGSFMLYEYAYGYGGSLLSVLNVHFVRTMRTFRPYFCRYSASLRMRTETEQTLQFHRKSWGQCRALYTKMCSE